MLHNLGTLLFREMRIQFVHWGALDETVVALRVGLDYT